MKYKVTTLDKFATIQGGYAYKSDDFKTTGNWPVLKIKNVRTGSIDYSDAVFVSDHIAEISNQWKTKSGDVLISMTGSGPSAPASLVGRVAKVRTGEPVGLINQRVGRLVVKDGVNICLSFLYYVLSQKETQHFLVANSTGSANQVNISGKIIGAVPCPDLDFQTSRAISGFLDSLEARIDLLRETNATLEAFAQAMFKSWFVDFDPVCAKSKGKLPEGMDEVTAGFFPDAFEETEWGVVPKGWQVQKFGDFIERLSVGKKFDQKTALVSGAVPILDQGKSGIIGFHNEAPGVKASLDTPVIVFANHTCYMRLICFDFSAIQNVLPFIGKGVDTVWAFYATKDRIKFSEYKGHWPDFEIEKTVVPSEDLTYLYRSALDPAVRRMRLNEIQAETLANLRDTLLPRLISGQLRISDADAELEKVIA